MKVTRHPNGFLRVEFFKYATGESDRLHIWDTPGLMEGGDIHQHEADFSSYIVAGVMQEDIYAYQEDPAGEWERWSVVCYTDDRGTYHVDDEPLKVRATPVLLQNITRHAGEVYNRPASDFHLVTALETPLITRSITGPATQRRHYFLRKRNQNDTNCGY